MLMVLFPLDMMYRYVGTQAVVSEISKKEKFWRKKYIAVFKWESTKMREIMVRFPITLNVYVINKKVKTRISSCGSLVSPRMKNIVTADWFLITDFIYCQSSIKVTEIESEKHCQIGSTDTVSINTKQTQSHPFPSIIWYCTLMISFPQIPQHSLDWVYHMKAKLIGSFSLKLLLWKLF